MACDYLLRDLLVTSTSLVRSGEDPAKVWTTGSRDYWGPSWSLAATLAKGAFYWDRSPTVCIFALLSTTGRNSLKSRWQGYMWNSSEGTKLHAIKFQNNKYLGNQHLGRNGQGELPKRGQFSSGIQCHKLSSCFPCFDPTNYEMAKLFSWLESI